MPSQRRDLFSSFRIGSKQTKNRFVLPGMQLGYIVDNGPRQALIDYYSRCVAGGIGMLITEALAIGHPSATWHDGGFLVERTASAWKQAVDAVHAENGLILAQLFHEGAIRKEKLGGPFPGYPTLSPSGLFNEGKPNGRAATREELGEIRDSFVGSALVAQRIGADGVEVHSAHGYFLDQFLWEKTNLREDEYGGATITSRARYLAEIVTGIRKVTGPDFIISVRFSQWKEVDLEAHIVASPDELKSLIRVLTDAGADLLHVSTRRFFEPEWEGSDLGLAGWTKSFSSIPVIANGSVGLSADVMSTLLGQDKIESTAEQSLKELNRRFANNEFDLISVGRSVIGDQEWVNKVQHGLFAKIRPFDRSQLAAATEGWDLGVIGETHGLTQRPE
jgi:2,4-dienoyl-CoA reductase-like NADH-dependent reductase (Old Yellow Enzyme family)